MASRLRAQDSISYGSLGPPVERAQAAPEKASSGSAPSQPVVTEGSTAGSAPTPDPATSSTTKS